MNKRITAGAGASLGAILVAPGAAQADDFRVTNLNDLGAGSLREAIDDANETDGADRVLFKSKLSGTIDLESSNLGIYGSDLEIVGPGARQLTIDGNDDSRVVTVFGEIPLYGSPDIDVTISGLRITGGEGIYGGGIAAIGELDLTISRATISGNEATGDVGGGISHTYVDGTDFGSIVIENSTISGNAAADNGGGIAITENHRLSLRNSTVSGNSTADDGGGISLQEGAYADQILNSTITDNTAAGDGGGLWENYEGATIRGSTVAGNSAANFDDLEGGTWPISFSIYGTDGDPDVIDEGGNLLNVDARLKPLKNNGGPTDTHAFKKSPAKNKGPSDAPNQDQRGAPRKGKPDIGAYEFTKCEGVIVNRVGTAGKDKLKGTKKKDGILGLGGNDKLAGKKGKDGLCGGSGKDKLKGGPGKDKLNGGPGKDKEVQ